MAVVKNCDSCDEPIDSSGQYVEIRTMKWDNHYGKGINYEYYHTTCYNRSDD